MIEMVIESQRRDLGGFEVGRVLPFAKKRMIGPFVFLDHIGPAQFASGQGIDVRPHPHIGLSTVTYLFEGQIFHQDSLGFDQQIRPGEVNWMTAGRGIVHSERTGPELRTTGSPIHGLPSSGFTDAHLRGSKLVGWRLSSAIAVEIAKSAWVTWRAQPPF